MDYSKSGNPKGAKHRPAYDDQNRHGAPKHAHGKAADAKQALLDRMKKAAEAKKQG